VLQRYLDELGGDSPAEPIVRALLDRAGAEDAWSQMLKLAVEPTDRTMKKPALKPTTPAASAPAPRAIVPGQPRATAARP
jgi:hypothetical protein